MTATKGISREERARQAQALVGKLIRASKRGHIFIGIVTEVEERRRTSSSLRHEVFVSVTGRRYHDNIESISIEQRTITLADGTVFEYKEG